MAKTNRRSIEKLVGQENGRKKLGYVVWWTLDRGFLMDGDKVDKIFQANGFTEKESKIGRDAEETFHKVMRISKGLKMFDGWLIRKIYYANDRIVYGIVKESILKKEEDLNYKREDKITLDRSSEKVTTLVGLPEAQFMVKEFNTRLGQVDNYRLIHFLLGQLHKVASMTLREMGGIYFVPAHYQDVLDRIEKSLSQMSPDSVLFMLPIFEDDKTKKSLKVVFDENFGQEMEKFTKDFEERLTADGARESTLKKRLTEYKEFKAHAQVYEDLLGFKAEEIKKGIASLEKKVKDLLSE